MTTRRDVDDLVAVNNDLVSMALRDLQGLVGASRLGTPELLREALLEIVPMLVREYGDLAAAAAADWYERLHPASYSAVAVEPAPEDAVRGSVRALIGDDLESTVAQLSGAMQRHILYSSRATVARNVQLDPMNPRFARVPSGAKTCAWCEMLASRGWVYHSRESAGGSAFTRFHDRDDCLIVPQWEQDEAHIAGYDPDAMYDRYMAARASLEAEGIRAPDDAQIAAQLRAEFPDHYTDGHVH